ncbi:hypothetical protein DEO72_LG8g2022 [Vigna unguiculata]|uniref:Uncharacterized protein n=1 Tax=Vigna unguiculata TaxID=3917 RepID=A0A4D6MR32_VIGUN|nr:hypothetical protein DEO72_LG8g2022 [Vigna unguiculata]
MSEDLSQLMNDAVRKVTLEDMMKMMTEMMKMNQTDQKEMMNAATQSLQSQSEKPIAESHHIDISIDRYNDCHSNMSTVVPVDEDMSTNDHFQEQSCKDNTIEEPSAVEEPTIFEDAAEASTIATDLVNDEATESTTPGENFGSQDEITRITDDPLNHSNAPDDAQVKLKPHTPHIKFVDVNDANKFSVVIFVDMTAEKEERLLQ